MANSSQAYDFSLFENSTDNTARELQPQRRESPRTKTKENVIDLPEKELKRNGRPKIHPLKAIATVVCFSLIFGTVISIVYSQVKLTELTEKINVSAQALEEARSTGIQLQMQAGERINATEVEEYAEKVLGMTKSGDGQITFVNPDGQDYGVVVQEEDSGSFFTNIINTIKSWFA